MKKQTTMMDFIKEFGSIESCRNYLCDLKWKDGFTCKKCRHQTPVKGRTWYYRKCQKCHFDESCTSGTLFHKLKFPLDKAFMMIYLITTHRKGVSTCELARMFGVKQTTAWYFKRKVQQAMSSDPTALLTGHIEVDETYIGGSQKGKQGRSYSKKKIVQVAIETQVNAKGKTIIKNASGTLIEKCDSESLKVGLLSMALVGSTVITDKWRSYIKATVNYKHEAKLSDNGQNFVKLHWHIFNLKNWLRGTHHHISNEHAQNYVNEFHFRFNRRNYYGSSPKNILKQMINQPWLPYKLAVGN